MSIGIMYFILLFDTTTATILKKKEKIRKELLMYFSSLPFLIRRGSILVMLILTLVVKVTMIH